MFRTLTTTCNLGCAFCDHETPPGADTTPDDTVVIGGGEPSLHEDLPGEIRQMRAAGARTVDLRTNGLRMAYEKYARTLAEAGLDRVRVLLPSHDPAVSDGLTRRPDAHALALRGMQNMLAAGIEVIPGIPLLRPTAPSLASTLEWIATTLPDVSTVDLVHCHAGGPGLQLSFDDLATPLRTALERAPSLGLHVRLDTSGRAPLCAVGRLPGYVPAGDDLQGPRVHPPACGTCPVREACPGMPSGHVDAFGDEHARPFAATPGHDPSAGADPLESLSTSIRYTTGAVGEKVDSASLRITRRCNQDCSFCFIPWEHKTIEDGAVDEYILAAVKAGASRIVLTGGEPTLHPDLPRFVETAREAGARWVELQTNGVLLSDRETCERLVQAGLNSVAVSVPSHLPDLLDGIAAVPGNLPHVLDALGHLSSMDLVLSVTHVVCTPNHTQVAELVRFLHERFRVHVFSILLAAPMSAPLARKDVIVRYSDAAPFIAEALDLCIESGVHFEGLWERCGMPLCVLKTNPRYHQGAAYIPDGNRGAEFIDAPGCASCTRASSCYRIRSLYAYLYGVGEFLPFEAP